MKTPSFPVFAVMMLAIVGLDLLLIGAPRSRMVAPARRSEAATAPLPSVAANGFALQSTAIDLPDDDGAFPDGPHADVINANCRSCHSASMALTQPRLSAEQWQAIVEKMRDTYKAPVAEKDVTAIVAYLAAMQGSAPPVHDTTIEPGADRSGGTG